MALSEKQKLFVAHYCDCWNASKAAQLAGYSAKTAGQIGYENLKKPEIAAAIAAHVEQIMPRGEILTRLAARARSTIADVINVRTGTWTISLAHANSTGGIHQIKKIKDTKYGLEVEIYDPLPALELLGRHAQLFGNDDGILRYLDLAKLTPDQLQRLADGESPIAVLLSTDSDPGQSPP